MVTVRLHTCVGQEYVAQGIDEPPADRCRCRQSISKEKAKKKVDDGEARFVVLSRTQESVEVPCPLCQADPEVKNCANCRGTGRVEVNNIKQEVGDDIVLVSRAAIDKKERKYRPALAMKTPRVATIESEHIYLAYCGENDAKSKAARDRIEEYGRLILDARMFIGPNRILAIKSEPENDSRTGTGRDFDFGRTI